MLQISIHLPPKYRLRISLSKRRKNLDEKPILPDLGEVIRSKKGNKLSRYFRILFENQKIKKIVGTNLTFLVIISSFLPASISGSVNESEASIRPPLIINTESGMQFPITKIAITQTYSFYHQGIDFDGITGDAIRPITSGVVEKVEYSRFGYGKTVIVSHGSSTKSLYAHLSKIDVVEGQEVTKDTKLGEMGATGRAFGDHLHLEIHENGRAINPLNILPRSL